MLLAGLVLVSSEDKMDCRMTSAFARSQPAGGAPCSSWDKISCWTESWLSCERTISRSCCHSEGVMVSCLYFSNNSAKVFCMWWYCYHQRRREKGKVVSVRKKKFQAREWLVSRSSP